MVQPLWKTVWRFLKKLKVELLHNPAMPLLRIYVKEAKTLAQKKHELPSHAHCSITYNVPEMETAHASIPKWVNEENVRHTRTHTGIVLSHKNKIK